MTIRTSRTSRAGMLASCALVACAPEAPDTDAPGDRAVARANQFPGVTEPITICDLHSGGFSADITNPYFPLPVCSRRVLRGIEGGVEVAVRITALDDTETIAGVTTRVVEELETEDDVIVEISYNFFAQAAGGGTPAGATSPRDGTVCYFGEQVDIFNEDGTVTHEGQWRAGVAGASPGIIMPGVPAKGQAYLQEVAIGVAEDRAWHTRLSAGRLAVLEDSPLEPGSLSSKIYEPGIGLARDNSLKLDSIEQLDECPPAE